LTHPGEHGIVGACRDGPAAYPCTHLSRRPKNDMADNFFELLYAPLPLLAPTLWLRFWFSLGHLCGEGSARLLRWLLVSAAGSAGGGVPPVYDGCAWIPSTKRVGQLAGSFVYISQIGISDVRVVAIDIGAAGIGPASFNRRNLS
jgi:hypothetical protein